MKLNLTKEEKTAIHYFLKFDRVKHMSSKMLKTIGVIVSSVIWWGVLK